MNHTQEGIDKGNKLIIEYRGGVAYNKRYPRSHGISGGGDGEFTRYDCIIEKAKFHTSMDWLYPVYQKVVKELNVMTENPATNAIIYVGNLRHCIGDGKEPIEIWNEIVAAIEWINSQKG